MHLEEGMDFVKLNKTQFETVVKWAEKEGWNPGINDAEVFWQMDPDGYYGVLKDGEIIASGSIVSYNGEFGFMGFFIVKPEYRSKGLGRKLWNKRKELLISRLKENAPIGMDGVVDMQPFYNKGGFVLSHRDVRMEGTSKMYPVSEHVSKVQDSDIEEILNYDKECFGYERKTFITNWIAQSNAKTFVYRKGEALQGFAVIRKAVSGYKIGPLFADNIDIAEELFKACSAMADGDLIYLDIPLINKSASELANKFSLKECFECGRMYFGPIPEIPMEKVFGVTTFELG